MLAAHHPLFALRLVQIRKSNDEKFERLFNHLLRSASIIESRLHGQLLEGKISTNQCAALEELEHVAEFQGLLSSMQSEEGRWISCFEHPAAESVVPEPWLQNDPDTPKEIGQLMKMIIVKILRPDRLVYASWALIEMVLGENVSPQSQIDLF